MKTAYEFIPSVDLKEIFYNTNRGEFGLFEDAAFDRHLKRLHEITIQIKERNPNLPSNKLMSIVLTQEGFWYKNKTWISG